MANITASDIQTRILDGVAAFESGDLETALTKLEAAQMLMGGIPRMALGSAAAKNEIEYTPEQLDAMIERVRNRVKTSRGGHLFYSTPVERTRTRDGYCG